MGTIRGMERQKISAAEVGLGKITAGQVKATWRSRKGKGNILEKQGNCGRKEAGRTGEEIQQEWVQAGIKGDFKEGKWDSDHRV